MADPIAPISHICVRGIIREWELEYGRHPSDLRPGHTEQRPPEVADTGPQTGQPAGPGATDHVADQCLGGIVAMVTGDDHLGADHCIVQGASSGCSGGRLPRSAGSDIERAHFERKAQVSCQLHSRIGEERRGGRTMVEVNQAYALSSGDLAHHRGSHGRVGTTPDRNEKRTVWYRPGYSNDRSERLAHATRSSQRTGLPISSSVGRFSGPTQAASSADHPACRSTPSTKLAPISY